MARGREQRGQLGQGRAERAASATLRTSRGTRASRPARRARSRRRRARCRPRRAGRLAPATPCAVQGRDGDDVGGPAVPAGAAPRCRVSFTASGAATASRSSDAAWRGPRAGGARSTGDQTAEGQGRTSASAARIGPGSSTARATTGRSSESVRDASGAREQPPSQSRPSPAGARRAEAVAAKRRHEPRRRPSRAATRSRSPTWTVSFSAATLTAPPRARAQRRDGQAEDERDERGGDPGARRPSSASRWLSSIQVEKACRPRAARPRPSRSASPDTAAPTSTPSASAPVRFTASVPQGRPPPTRERDGAVQEQAREAPTPPRVPRRPARRGSCSLRVRRARRVASHTATAPAARLAAA